MALNFKPFQMLTSVRLTIHVRMAPLVLTMLADISFCVPQDIKENNAIKVQAALFDQLFNLCRIFQPMASYCNYS